MPVKPFTLGIEPPNQNAPIWRFMEMWKFRDLIATGELFFNRADRFQQDEQEGIPPEEYIIRARSLNPLDLKDRLQLNSDVATLAQFRESMYVNCWYLFDEEKSTLGKRTALTVLLSFRRTLGSKPNWTSYPLKTTLIWDSSGTEWRPSRASTPWSSSRPNESNMRTIARFGPCSGFETRTPASTVITTSTTSLTLGL